MDVDNLISTPGATVQTSKSAFHYDRKSAATFADCRATMKSVSAKAAAAGRMDIAKLRNPTRHAKPQPCNSDLRR